MHIITVRHINRACRANPEAARELRAWVKLVKAARWCSFEEVRLDFADADLRDDQVAFNLPKHGYRLLAKVRYCHELNGQLTEGHIFIQAVPIQDDRPQPPIPRGRRRRA